jgi:membrane-associated phospholipid phosphatase
MLGSSKADRLAIKGRDDNAPYEIRGLAGDDTLTGGSFDDLMTGDDGADLLVGGNGRDTLLGGTGTDRLRGGDGADLLDGGAGRDTLDGDDGADTLAGGEDADALDGGDGADLLAGDGGRDTIDGGDGRDTLLGGEGDDLLRGDDGNDRAEGGAGADTLRGADGDDVLAGGDGDDVMQGAAGADSLDGGAGEDVALFRGRFADYAITLLDDGALRVEGVRAAARQDGADVVRAVEWLRFADLSVSGDTTPPRLEITGFATDTGIAGDGITADRDPVIAGTATPGVRVEVFRDGTSIGSVQADADGGWSIADSGLEDGGHTYTARAYGNFGVTADAALPLHVEIDATAPDAPTLRLAAASDSGAVGDGATAFAAVALVGTAEAGATVTVEGTGTTLTVGEDGTFSLRGIALDAGTNSFVLHVTDAAGNTTTGSFAIEREATVLEDPVLAWNHITLEAIKAGGSVTAVATRILTMESVAVHDVLAAIEGQPTLKVALDAPEGISATAAVAAAAHRVMTHLYPGQAATFDARYAYDLSTVPDGAARDEAVAFGQAVADAVIAMRLDDGWNAPVTYVPGTDIGDWRPTPLPFRPALNPQWGDVQTWATLSGDQFRPAGPPDLTSEAYAAALNEVKEYGRIDSTLRTADQTETVFYWADQAGTYTPAGRWAQIAAEVLEAGGHDSMFNARTLALLNIVGADAAIAAWDAKYEYNFWRPVTAIRLADQDGNPLTEADPTWSPLLNTPNHPEYVSGHSTCSMATAWVLTLILGDDYAFSNASVGFPDIVRSFDSFVDAAVEASLSRIYGGIHYRFSGMDGLALGRQVADFAMARLTSDQDSFAPVVVVADGAAVVAAPPVVEGFAFDNVAGFDGLMVSLDGGAAQAVEVDASGRFALDVAARFGALAEGAHELVFTASDAAGNVTAPVAYAFTLDDPFV